MNSIFDVLDKEFLGKTIAIIVLFIFSFIYIEYKKNYILSRKIN